MFQNFQNILGLKMCLTRSKVEEICIHFIILLCSDVFIKLYDIKRKNTHNFTKAPLELDIGLTRMVNVGLAVFTPQSKLVVH